MPKALYVHVPFCPKICPYCDFHKMRRNEDLVTAYLARLAEEAEALYDRFPGTLDTVYFGGGTPSHLSDHELTRLIRLLERTWGWPPRLEATLEADPLTFDRARLDTFADLSFNRLSMGLQSSQDPILRFLGRLHDGRQGLAAVAAGLEAGFNVSADLITAVPEQDTAGDLHAFAATGVPHISVYNLSVEPHTPFAVRGVTVDPDKEADDYLLTNTILSDYGYRRYEISSHAREGFEAVHNQIYWHGEHFLALGPSAAGFVPGGAGLGVRYQNPPIKAWLQGAAPSEDVLNAEGYILERLITGLRTRRGVDLNEISRRSGIALDVRFAGVIEEGVMLGLLEREPNGSRFRATDDGMIRLDAVLREFL